MLLLYFLLRWDFFPEVLKTWDESKKEPLANKRQVLNSAATRCNLKEKVSRNTDPNRDVGVAV